MKVVIATPLYPPDIAEPAPYVKELARRLAHDHEVTVVAYGEFPEQVAGVRLRAVSKRRMLPLRLASFGAALWRETADADVLLVENGPSTELPAGIVARLRPLHMIAHQGDAAAHARAARTPMLGRIERFLASRARATLTSLPLPRPEILPFGEVSLAPFAAYEASWARHLADVETALRTPRHG